MKHTSTHKTLIVAFCTMLLAVGAYFVELRIILVKHEALAGKLVELSTVAEHKASSLSAESIVEDTAVERATLSSFFTTEENAVAFIQTIESIAEHSNVQLEIRNASAEESPADSTVRSLKLTFDVEGSWSEVSYFTALVDTLPLSIVPQQAFLEKTKLNGGSTLWRGQFILIANATP